MKGDTERWLLPAALAAFLAVGAASAQPGATTLAVAAPVMAIATIVLAVRNPRGWWLVAVLAAALAAGFVVMAGSSGNVGWFSVCVATGMACLRAEVRAALALAAGCCLVFVGLWVAEPHDAGWSPWIAGTVFTVVVCLLTRRQADLNAALHLAQADLADRARVSERARIAGELHDVIGHSLTVSLLHLGSARLAVQDEPEAAVGALVEAERLCRNALAEVRQAVGLLGPDATRIPAPRADDLPALVADLQRAGAPVELIVQGALDDVPATTGLTLYRVTQEALTNVARHAVGATTAVRVAVTRDRVVARIENGPGTTTSQESGGQGLITMRERCEAVGGTVVAGPWQGGWRVEVTLPLLQAIR